MIMKNLQAAKVSYPTAVDAQVAGSRTAAVVAPAPSAEAVTEVAAVARRRRFTSAEKRRIVAAADACTQAGEVGALLRREGLYSSHLAAWRKQRDAADLSALEPKKRGPKADPGLADARRIADLTRENGRLRTQLSQAHLIIDVQKKISLLLGLAPTDESSGNRS